MFRKAQCHSNSAPFPEDPAFCVPHAPAPRWCLTPALTGTALAARSREDKRLNGDVSSKVHLQGRVRGRMPRLGMTTMLLAATTDATGLSVMKKNQLCATGNERNQHL
jgi:hypothetical protein